MRYSQKKLINKGIKYFSTLGEYLSFSEIFNSSVSPLAISFCSGRSSINEVVDSETDASRGRLFGSLIIRKAINCINGMTSINSNIDSGIKPKSLKAA